MPPRAAPSLLPPIPQTQPRHPTTPPNRRNALFSIFYSTSFLLASLLLAASLLITPGDHIYQAFRDNQIQHVIIVAGVYILTALVAVVVYAGRLFRTRSALAHVGKVEERLRFSVGGGEDGGRDGEGEGGGGMRLGCKVPLKVARVVRAGLARSARIAFEGTPRELGAEGEGGKGGGVSLFKRARRRRPGRLGTGKDMRENGAFTSTAVGDDADADTVWGHIAHPGWSRPESGDLQRVQFEAVVVELGGLVEAKAVSLAPLVGLEGDAGAGVGSGEGGVNEGEKEGMMMPDPLVVNLLRRPGFMDLRDYMAHLTTLGMITPPEIGTRFLASYQRARFSGEAVREEGFRELMAVFAQVLRGMRPVGSEIVEGLHETAEAELDEEEEEDDELDPTWEDGEGGDGRLEDDEVDAHSLASNGTVNRTPQPPVYATPSSSSAASVSSSTSSGQGTIRTDRPSRPRNQRYTSARSNSSVVQCSLKKMRSDTSTSTRSVAKSDAGSVIRLAEAKGPLDLPYAFVTEGTGPS